MTTLPTFVSFYTPDYAEHADRLRKSLDEFSLKHRLVELPDTGHWVKNCNMKPGFLFDQLMTHLEPVVWIDADAEVMRYPTVFDRPSFDFAVCDRGRKGPQGGSGFGSGTVYLNPDCLHLVALWRALAKREPMELDQRLLERSWKWLQMRDLAPDTYWLPHSYLTKVDDPNDAVILHHQASRAVRKKKR